MVDGGENLAHVGRNATQYDPSKVLVIDTTEDFKGNPERLNEMFEQLKVFVNKK